MVPIISYHLWSFRGHEICQIHHLKNIHEFACYRFLSEGTRHRNSFIFIYYVYRITEKIMLTWYCHHVVFYYLYNSSIIIIFSVWYIYSFNIIITIFHLRVQNYAKWIMFLYGIYLPLWKIVEYIVISGNKSEFTILV